MRVYGAFSTVCAILFYARLALLPLLDPPSKGALGRRREAGEISFCLGIAGMRFLQAWWEFALKHIIQEVPGAVAPSGFHLLQSSQQFSPARRGHLATCSTGCGLIKQLRIHLRIQAHFRKGDDT